MLRGRSANVSMLKFVCSLMLLLTAASLSVHGCDLCGCYTPQVEALSAPELGADGGLSSKPTLQTRSWTQGIYAAVAEQFTYFGTLQEEGHEISNPTGQHLDSSITQVVLGYGLNTRLALQLNVPFIVRSFERPEGFAIDRGTESGVGDLSLLGKFVLFHGERGGARSVTFDDPKSPRMQETPPDFTYSAILLGGVKFPIGATDRLKEEFVETEIPGAPVSGIHGHDLTLGTGSWDGLFGVQTSVHYRRAFAQTDIQFTLRGDGAHQYHFANDLTWSGGPGVYLLQTQRALIGLQTVVSGEYKDVDRFRGKVAEDTGITSVFLGPRVVASFGKVSAEVELDLPVSIDNTSIQVVPDYRIRAAVALRF